MLHDYIRALKAKTDGGAVLLLDGDLHMAPRWLISKRRIALKEKMADGGTCEHTIWDASESTEAEAEKWLRANIRILVDDK